ncbi:MAG: hypothetical protein QOG42_420 [Solirubrobacteraceae bacterium]|jgi:hypothetical protein|nr:hypothetical protein [Solirubrobacteraceae bacterium]
MGFVAKLLLGSGTLKAELRAALESEGLVLIEEGLTGSIRYTRFRAPGRYHDGRITGVRLGLGISEERVALYCRSGRSKLVDTPFGSARVRMLDVSLEDEGRVAFRVDYDLGDVPDVSGEITIVARSPNAARIVDELRARLKRAAARRPQA